MHSAIRKTGAAFLATAGLTLVSAQAAAAQTPTTPTTPPLSPTAPTTPTTPGTGPDLTVSLFGEGGTFTDQNGDGTYKLRAFVANVGNRPATNVHLVISLPEELDGREIADEAACRESSSSQEGDFVCDYGSIAAGDKFAQDVELRIDQDHARGNERAEARVFIQQDAGDTESANDAASQRVDISTSR